MPIIDAALDAGLDYIADNGDKLIIVSDEDVAKGVAESGLTVLGSLVLTVGDGNGDFDIADYTGTGGGRKLSLVAKDITASATGTGNSWCITNGTNVLASESINAKSITSGQTYEQPAITVAVIKDATAITA